MEDINKTFTANFSTEYKLLPCETSLLTRRVAANNSEIITYDRIVSGIDIGHLFLGLISNALALVVFNKCSFRRTSSTMILISTAVVDTITVLTVGVLSNLVTYGDVAVLDIDKWTCRFLPCLTRFLIAAASLSVALLALERILAFTSRCCGSTRVCLNRRGTIIILLVTYILVLICHLPCLIWSRYDDNTKLCLPWTASEAWTILHIDLFLQNILPICFTVLVCFGLLGITLCAAYSNVKSPMDKWATTLTMCAQAVYLVASLPQLAYNVLLLYQGGHYEIQSCDEALYIRKQTVGRLLACVFNLSLSLKPTFYVICSRYRRELLGTICTNPNFRPKLPRDSVMVTQRQGL